MSLLIGITTKTIMTAFAEGAILAVNVYLAIKGIKARKV